MTATPPVKLRGFDFETRTEVRGRSIQVSYMIETRDKTVFTALTDALPMYTDFSLGSLKRLYFAACVKTGRDALKLTSAMNLKLMTLSGELYHG